MSYEGYSRLMPQDRRTFAVEELTEEDLAEIAGARMTPGHDDLDEELSPKDR